jgi:hypothetical protein
MAYTYAYTGVGDPSTILRSDGVEFPQEPGLKTYEDWLAFVAGGGTTTPASSVTIATRRAAGKLLVDKLAGDYRRSLTRPGGIDEDLSRALRFKEAQDYEADGSPSDPDYPLLGAEVPGNGVSVDAVHDAVLTELATLKTALATAEGARRTARDDIDAASDQSGIDAVIAALDFT